MRRLSVTKVAAVVLLFIIIVTLAFLFSDQIYSLLSKERPLTEKVVRLTPSFLLVLFRFDLLDGFILVFGALAVSILLIIIMLYWLVVAGVRRNRITPRTRIVLIAIGLAAAFSVTIYSFRYVQSRLLFTRGYQKSEIREDTEAAGLYLASAKLAPSFSQPYIELMKAYGRDQRYLNAIEVGKRYLRQGSNFHVLTMLGKLYSTVGDYENAITYYSRGLQMRESVQAAYEMAHAFFMMSEYEKAIQICLDYPGNSRFLYLRAKCLLESGRYDEGLKAISDAIRLNPADPNYWYTRGKLLSSMNRDTDALKSFEEAVWLKKEFPKAYIEMAGAYFKQGDISSSRHYLKKVVYYDNTMSEMFIWLQALNEGKSLHLEEIKTDSDIRIILPTLELKIEKDEAREMVVKVEVPTNWNSIKTACIEPYGWGITCRLVEEHKVRHQDRLWFVARYRIVGNRDSRVNLGEPWRINVVAFNPENGNYHNEILKVTVTDNREGKILFVLTEDLETGEGPHIGDATPERVDLSVEEVEVALIKKGILSDEIANSYGIKWSHIVDVGSSYRMVRWLSEVSKDPGWRGIWEGLKKYLTTTISSGNDVQLHIHSYNIPDSPNFTYRYDRETNQSVYHPAAFDGPSGAWADMYTNLGYFDDPLSRVGSLFEGAALYESLLHSPFPNYRVLFFRAGEWEFGESEEEMQKSVIALRKTKILAGSNAYEGQRGDKGFSFRRRIGENVYFTRFDNIREPAKSLLDIGILEILPVTELHHYSHVRPIDDPMSITTAYDLCFDSEGRIKSGVHILVEMYHINRINHGDARWDSLDSNYGDWFRIKRHFENVFKYATEARFVTISQAIIEYLDYYTPDILALRVNERKESETRYVYDIKMFGNDIPIDYIHTHYVSVKPPSYLVDRISAVTLLYDGKAVKTWDKITSYEDLEFEAVSTSGYTLRVDLETT